MGSFARRAYRLGGVAIALLPILVGCAAPRATTPPSSVPVPSSSPSAASSSEATATQRIPPLLVFVPSGADAGLWRIDPNADPSALAWRARVAAPPGRWRPTAPAPGGLVALTSVDEAPVRVALARMDGDSLVPVWVTNLPSSDRWEHAGADCVSAGGAVVVGDGGLTLFVVDAEGGPTPVPGQADNLGDCTWVGSDLLLWDQERAPLRSWMPGVASSVPTAVQGREPSAAGGRLAWAEPDPVGNANIVRIARVSTSPAGLELGGGSRPLTVGNPGAIALSPDGRWLAVVGLPADDRMTIFEATDSGVFGARVIGLASLPLAPGGSVTWLPSSP